MKAEDILSKVVKEDVRFLIYHESSDMINPREAIQAMQEYAKLKVEEALKLAADNAVVYVKIKDNLRRVNCLFIPLRNGQLVF